MLHTIVLTVSLLKGFTGYCNDQDISCANWAKMGECTGENAEPRHPNLSALLRHMPLSLSGDESCSNWARDGHCETNEFYDQNLSHQLRSLHPDLRGHWRVLRAWAKNGSCVDNPSYMLTHCPRACGVCQFSCVDLHNDCPGWAMEDQCNTNAPFMVKTCPKSCRVCEDNLGCKDFNSTLCEMWGQPGCEGNPVAVLRDCPRTCGVCTNVCLDKSENCTSWMHSGECDANPIAMGKKCPQACGICHQIEALHNPFPEKDEL